MAIHLISPRDANNLLPEPTSPFATFLLVIARLHGSVRHLAFARTSSSSSRSQIVHHERLLANVYSSSLPVSRQQLPKSVFKTLSVLDSGIYCGPRRCWPDPGDGTRIGFFFRLPWRQASK